MDKTLPLVTVSCLAFNHKEYIRDALNSFVGQKTDFPFEVIVHDDASTDGTTEIIREYAEKYPDIIRPIFQTENILSKGIRASTAYILPAARGKYIAYCEGDDYWSDENKLQKLADFLEKHPDYVACTHNNRIYDCLSGEECDNFVREERDLALQDVVMNGGQSYHTSSLLCRAELMKTAPAFVFSILGLEDYPIAIYLTLCGKIHYFADVMSVYRLHTAGSWSSNFLMLSPEEASSQYDTRIRMLEGADEYSLGRFHALFRAAIDGYQFRKYKVMQDYPGMLHCPHFKTLALSERVKLTVKRYLPFTRELKKKLTEKIRSKKR